MPNIKSAIKRVAVAERNRQRNVAYKSALRTAVKGVLQRVAQHADKTELEQALSKAFSLIDRAILKGILHKNTGARYKSRLAQRVQKAA